MTVEVWRFTRTGFSHENAALLHLARQLDALSEHFLIIANPAINGHELDGLIFKRDMVFVIEFKKVCGPVTGGLRGPWIALCEDGALLPLNEGREDNPFQQVQHAYFAALNFLKNNQDAFLTASEAAVTDFKKIKNVLILDPEYDAEASRIELGKEAWKLIIVGLYNELADPFITQRHEKINLTVEQMRIIARDVLCCQLDEDIEHLLPPETQAEAAAPEAVVLLEPLQPVPDIHHRETLDARFDSPIAPLPLRDRALSNPIHAVKRTLSTLREQTAERKAALQRQFEQERERWYATHPLDFEALLDELRQAADRTVHHLPPETLAANVYTVELNEPSFENLAPLRAEYQTRLESHLLDYISQQGYQLAHKPLTIQIQRGSTSKPIAVRTEFLPPQPVARIEGPDGQQRELFPGSTILVGRGMDADFSVSDDHEQPVISRKHCYVLVSKNGETVTVRDYPSANGTFLNGQRISSVKLSESGTLLLGRRDSDGAEGLTLRVVLLKEDE